MAILNDITRISDYIRIGTRNNFCIICSMKRNKLKTEKGIDEYYKSQEELKGKLYGQPVIYFNRRGLEQCICMDCVKEIAKEYTDLVDPADMINDNFIINEQPTEIEKSETETIKEEQKKETKKKDTKKKENK